MSFLRSIIGNIDQSCGKTRFRFEIKSKSLVNYFKSKAQVDPSQFKAKFYTNQMFTVIRNCFSVKLDFFSFELCPRSENPNACLVKVGFKNFKKNCWSQIIKYINVMSGGQR